MAGQPVTGDIYVRIDGRLHEIKNQIRGKNGYPFDLRILETALQRIVDGHFTNESVIPTNRRTPIAGWPDGFEAERRIRYLGNGKATTDVLNATWSEGFERYFMGVVIPGGSKPTFNTPHWEVIELDNDRDLYDQVRQDAHPAITLGGAVRFLLTAGRRDRRMYGFYCFDVEGSVRFMKAVPVGTGDGWELSCSERKEGIGGCHLLPGSEIIGG